MKNKLKQYKTKKLHYGKYLYKLALANSMSPWFRTEFQKSGNLKLLKKKIDEFQVLYDLDRPMYRQIYRSDIMISNEEFLDAKDCYKILINSTDYKIRVEKWHGFCIYSNDKAMLLNIASSMRISAREFWEPDTNVINKLLNEENIVLVDTPHDNPIKVTFNYKKIDPRLAKWLESNKDKSKAGTATLNNISGGYAPGNYIFLRDERVLTMVQMIAGHNIQRIERLVCMQDIDK